MEYGEALVALQFVAEKAFHFTQGDNHDKIWAAAVAKDANQGVYMAVWGKRIGAFGSSDKYQSQQMQGSVGAMDARYQNKVREKEGKGYIQVPFNDPAHGSIPSFSGGNVVAVAGSAGQQITSGGLLKQIESLIARLIRKSASGVEMNGLIMEFQQVKVKTEIFVEFGGASGDEKVKIAALTGQLQSRLQSALVG